MSLSKYLRLRKTYNISVINKEVNRIKLKSSFLKGKLQYETIEPLQVELLRKSNLKIIIEGEQIYITDIIIPTVSRCRLDEVIKIQLESRFLTLSNLLYDYKLVKKSKKNMKVRIYCINGKDLIVMARNKLEKSWIKSIDVYQLLLLKSYGKVLRKKEFLLISFQNNFIYIVMVKDKFLAENKTIELKEEEIFNEIQVFLNYVKDKGYELKTIYAVYHKVLDSLLNKEEIREEYEISFLS